MLRITQYLQMLKQSPNAPLRLPKPPSGPVVIWNLLRRCNLTCKHCYSVSADKDFPGELSTSEIFKVMDDLKAFGVPVLILSGGEPLLRPDIFEISRRAKQMGFYVGLSTNGTLINPQNIQAIAEAAYDYVGISLDGIGATHDRFRRKVGAFDASLQAVRLCKQAGIKVGIRFTLTQDNQDEFPRLLDLLSTEDIDKFYLSHLNYGGRGNKHRQHDVHHQMTRAAMTRLFETCWHMIEAGQPREFVTGNNDADGVFLLWWVRAHFPDHAAAIETKLRAWGGNAAGVNIANIDNLGQVHPDTFWSHHTLGNVRERPFSALWQDCADPILAGLKQRPRPLKGRCGSCQQQAICGGNTRVRAYQLSGDLWAEDPGCYLSDAEIGLAEMPVAVSA